MNKNRRNLMMAGLLTSLLVVGACSDQEHEGTAEGPGNENEDLPSISDPDQEPITLRMAVPFDEGMFTDRFKEPVEEKFPHITLEHIDLFTYYQPDIEEFFMSGETADIFFTMFQDTIEDLEMDQDLTELLDRHSISTDHINQTLLDTIRARDAEGRLVSWPYEDTYYALLYNKDIFDLLGEPYPSNDLTWDEVIDLADRLTLERGGIHYRGLDFVDDVMLSQFAVNATDPETGEVQILAEPAFTKYLEMFERYLRIPGNQLEEDEGIFADHRFYQDQTTAMLITNAQALTWYADESFNYDIATVPTWEELPGVAPTGFLQTMTINPMSEHQDTIIQLFDYLASDEYQIWMARNGIGIVSENQEVLDEFYQDFEHTHDLDIQAIFQNTPASPPERISLWDDYVEINIEEFNESGMVPTEFLRVVQEESETAILEAKQSQ